MTDRKTQLTIEDEAGASREGELVIVRCWQPQLAVDPKAAFTIVLADEPLPVDAPVTRDERVIVCGPGRPVRIDRRVRESPAAYGAGSHESTREGLRLTAVARAAFAAGRLLSARPLSLLPEHVFGQGASQRFDLLARAMLHSSPATTAAAAYWRAAETMLAWPEPAARTPPAGALLTQDLPPAPAAEPSRDLLLELARAHPTVKERQVEVVTETLRSLLQEALQNQRERDGGAARRMRVRLGYPANQA